MLICVSVFDPTRWFLPHCEMRPVSNEHLCRCNKRLIESSRGLIISQYCDELFISLYLDEVARRVQLVTTCSTADAQGVTYQIDRVSRTHVVSVGYSGFSNLSVKILNLPTLKSAHAPEILAGSGAEQNGEVHVHMHRRAHVSCFGINIVQRRFC